MADANGNRRTITSLADMRGQDTIAEIQMADGEILEIPFRTLSYSEWQKLEHEYPQPTPPVVPGKDGMYPDTKDVGYQKKMQEWNDKVAYLRILKSVKIDIPGETTEEQIENLRRDLSTPVMMGLISAIMQAHFGLQSQVVTRAKSFHGGGSSDQPRVSANGVEPEPVRQPE